MRPSQSCVWSTLRSRLYVLYFCSVFVFSIRFALRGGGIGIHLDPYESMSPILFICRVWVVVVWVLSVLMFFTQEFVMSKLRLLHRGNVVHHTIIDAPAAKTTLSMGSIVCVHEHPKERRAQITVFLNDVGALLPSTMHWLHARRSLLFCSLLQTWPIFGSCPSDDETPARKMEEHIKTDHTCIFCKSMDLPGLRSLPLGPHQTTLRIPVLPCNPVSCCRC